MRRLSTWGPALLGAIALGCASAALDQKHWVEVRSPNFTVMSRLGETETIELGERDYHLWKNDGVARAGVVLAPPEVHPLWLPYVRVEDPVEIGVRAATLGARVVMQDERTVILIDPTGAPIAVQAWERRDSRATGGTR